MRRLIVLVSLALPIPTIAHAGALSGSVRTLDGTPLPSLVLRLEGTAARIVVTGTEGRYRVSPLPAGAYRIVPLTPGLVVAQDAQFNMGDGDLRLDLALIPAPVSEQIVVAATRGDAALSTLGVSASVLSREQIEDRDSSSLLRLLQEVPGMTVAPLGGVGPQASAFVRGGESRFARILVDGVAVNEPGGYYNFGSLLPLELERIEVVRGAASSLYGSDALAGVVELVTRRAASNEALGVHLEAEGGNFDWRRFQGGASGRAGVFDWNGGLLRLDTRNEQPNSHFGETSGAGSFGASLSGGSTLRFTLRAEGSDAGTPGPTAFVRPDLDAHYEHSALVLGAQFRHVREGIVHDVRVGWGRTNQLSLNPLDSGPYLPRFGDLTGRPGQDFPDPSGFQNNTRRFSLGYQAEIQVGSRNLVTAGSDLEQEAGDLGTRGAPDPLSPKRTNVGAYLQDRIVLSEGLFATLGGRLERNESFGTVGVPRLALAWRVRGGNNPTTLKASAGQGIKEPGFFESFGKSFYAHGNPNLRPERSTTLDAGVEQRLLGSRLRVEAVYFFHEYKDQIAFQVVDPSSFQGSYFNLGKTRAQGVELSLEAAPAPWIRVSGEYTLLDGKILVSTTTDPLYAPGQPLLRRPRHQGALAARVGNDKVALGTTLVLVGRRSDSDFLGLGLMQNDAYARLDARAHVGLGHGLEALVMSENLLDRKYQEVLGYPALGRSLRAGVRFRSGTSTRRMEAVRNGDR